ncbi:MAG: hypothetical protein HY708_08435 [Ignavibacteriae bacterium]|nr:hypothetical protein [Ignavibacteriota bacterium]
MLLTIVGIMLLGAFMLAANSLMADNVRLAEENEYILTAIALAQSVLDEAKTKAFDAATVSGPVSSPSQLTGAGSLGPNSSEATPNPDTLFSTGYRSSTKFNDVDDYNNYNRLVNTPRAEGYRINVIVQYASTTYPDSIKSFTTFCKRMTLTVTSPYISTPVKLTYAFLY